RGVGPPEEAAALAARVSAASGFGELETLPWRELSPELSSFLDIADVYGLIVLLIVFVAAAAGVMNTMLMSTFERRRELGMLLSLGTTPMRLVRLILTEAVIMGLLGVLLGSLIGGLLVYWQGQSGISIVLSSEEEVAEMAIYGVTFSGDIYPYLRPSDFIPGFVGIFFVSIAAALWPALHTARLEPMEAMRS
ncbi:MAG: ABC transporter permease, partial [Myxococcales bacterium]|nr:ABC transporter permease [Myxococcales bacterium]